MIVKLKDCNKFKENEEILYISKLKGYSYAYRAKVLKKKSDHVYLINDGS
jgi:hypothetical protein